MAKNIYIDNLQSQDAYKYEDWLIEEGYGTQVKLEPYGRFVTIVIDIVGLDDNDIFYLEDLLDLMEQDGGEVTYV